MIETALIFILGFLCAVFISFFIAPAVYKLSYQRSRKDVEASLPLTLDEINAQKDGLRARYAAEVAGLEMRIRRSEEARAIQKIELGKNHQELKRVPMLENIVSALEADKNQLHDEYMICAKTAEQLQLELQELRENYTALHIRHAELKELEAVTRLELATNETNSDNLHSQIAELRRSHKEFDMRENKLKAEMTAIQTALNNEKQKNAQLEEKLARLIALLSDAEEKLGRTTKSNASDEDAIREQIQEIAAEMVVISAAEEGEQSPIHGLLQKSSGLSALTNANERREPVSRKKTSLAKRIDSLSRNR